MNLFSVSLIVLDDLSLLPRLALRMRKYGIDVLSYQKTLKEGNLAQIEMRVQSVHEDISVSMKKIQALIPVVELSYENIND